MEFKCGYDCNYVDKPPRAYECPICLLVLRDPHMVDCCGRKYCQTCIGQVQEAQKPCPVCNCSFKVSILEKQLQREIGDIKVYCSNKSSGCDWSGELRDLEQHQQQQCSYTPIQCTLGCGQELQRTELEDHVAHSCKNRSVQAQLDSCMMLFEKRLLKQDEVITQQRTVIEQQAEEIAKLTKLIIEHKERIAIVHSNKILPRYSVYLNAMNEFWYSPPFYTEESGYKLRMKLHTTHRPVAPSSYNITLSIELLAGENDSFLVWPVDIKVLVEIYCHMLKEVESEIQEIELKQVERSHSSKKMPVLAECCVREWKKYEPNRQTTTFYANVSTLVIGFSANFTVLKTTVNNPHVLSN